jgi:hypothetical protein
LTGSGSNSDSLLIADAPDSRTRNVSAMKSKDLFKDIFSLAVRLLGLVFLYLGLSAVPPLLDFGAIETAARSDIITAFLPIAFDLAVAWWLLDGRWLIRRAYPEPNNFSAHSSVQGQSTTPATTATPPQGATDADAADKKLAALVERTK